MYTTQRNNKVPNSHSVEPQVVCAEYPAVYEQRRDVFQAAVSALLVTATIMIALIAG